MSSAEKSEYNSFNSSVTDDLLTPLREKGEVDISFDNKADSSVEEKNEIPSLDQGFEEKDVFDGENLRNLSWKIFDNYFSNTNRLTQHHLDSYNHFINFTIPKIIKDYNPIVVKTNYNKNRNKFMDEYHINFGDIYLGKPGIKENDGKTKMLYPSESRWRNLTYSAELYLDVYQKSIKHSDTATGQPTVKEYAPMKKVSLRTIPIMVKSQYCPLSANTGRSQSELGECEYDKGGYFIVKGSEKVLISQERKL